MNILITGGAGFIAQHLGRELVWAGHNVVGVDLNPVVGGPGHQTSAFVMHPTADLRMAGVLERHARRHQAEVIVHLAAQVGRVFGEDDVHHTVTQNALMCVRAAQAADAVGARLVYASTSEVYGDQGMGTCTEDGPLVLPHNLYGLSKRWGEEACQLYAPDGLQILRLSMPYGPGLPAGRGRAAIVNFLYNALHDQPITVHRNSTRCWCWVGDTCRGIRMVIEQGEQGPRAGIYNVGRDDNECSMLDVAHLAIELAGRTHLDAFRLITEVNPPANQTVVKRLDTAKLRALGWRPEVDLRTGMERTYQQVKLMAPPQGVRTAV